MNLFRYFRTSPSSGQATTRYLLRNPKLVACHSGAALEGCEGHANGEDAVEFVVGRYPGILLTSSEFD
jgi:hypothetical protein